MKTCSKCGETKPLTEYAKCGGGARRGDCRACSNATIRGIQAKCREEWSCLTDDEIRRYTLEKRCPSCVRTLPSSEFGVNKGQRDGLHSNCRTCTSIAIRKGVARKEGLPATLTWQEIGDPPDECPCCGVTMERANGGTDTSPSLDKLVPELGYTKQNAIWICGRCNRRKVDWTLGGLYAFADWLWEEYKRRGIPLPQTLNRRILEG